MNRFLDMRRKPRDVHVGRGPIVLRPNVIASGRPKMCGTKDRNVHARGLALMHGMNRKVFNSCLRFRAVALYPVYGGKVVGRVLAARRIS